MEMTSPRDGGHQCRINVTPLVDVVLVLLILFMVIVPVARRAYELDVPVRAPAAEREGVPADRQIILAIDAALCPSPNGLPEAGLPADCRVRVAGRELGVASLAAATERIFAARDERDRVLFLAAEDELPYELVLRIVDIARSRVPDLGIGLVAVVGDGP